MNYYDSWDHAVLMQTFWRQTQKTKTKNEKNAPMTMYSEIYFAMISILCITLNKNKKENQQLHSSIWNKYLVKHQNSVYFRWTTKKSLWIKINIKTDLWLTFLYNTKREKVYSLTTSNYTIQLDKKRWVYV